MDIVPGDRRVDCRDKGEALNRQSNIFSLSKFFSYCVIVIPVSVSVTMETPAIVMIWNYLGTSRHSASDGLCRVSSRSRVSDSPDRSTGWAFQCKIIPNSKYR